jgi:hypothetical protein
MTVTSIATLQLLPNVKPDDLKGPLQNTIAVMEAASNDLAANVESNFPTHNSTHIPDNEIPHPPPTPKHTFHIYHQHEDPSIIYILGSWPSRSLHMNSFISTPANMDLVAQLKPYVSFPQSTVHHIALNPSLIPTSAPILAIRHHAISPANLAAFEETFDAVQHHLAHASSGNQQIASGWQIEKANSGGAHASDPEGLGDGSEVFVLFSGWDDLGHQKRFEESEKGKEYERVREWVDEGGLEVRHARKVVFEGSE